jgi:DMSO/TMAO reductase YedYZ molybdopterin-dependent catalytic subunit
MAMTDFSLSRRNLMRLLAGAAAAVPTVPSLFSAPNWVPTDRPKKGMIVRSTRPEDLEMPLEGFLDDITPLERLFVRSHHYTPKVDLGTWKLKIGGRVSKPVELTFEQIQKMPKVEVVAVMECAGNGRSFFEPSMAGLQWEHGAVGNVKWGGVRLADVLKLAGVDEKAVEVIFDGADTPVGTQSDFQRGIPLNRAMSPEVMLAYEANGQPLPTSHGFPLRVVVPGWASDSWTKWLVGIQVLDKPFEGFYMKTAYRHPGKAAKPGTAVDPAQMVPVTRLKPKSVLTFPTHNAQVEVGKPINITGVVWSGGGAPVTVGQISVDGGATWENVRPSTYNGPFAWRSVLLTYTPPEEGYYRILIRAGDNTGEIQPNIQSWNPSGYGWNACHWIGVDVVKEVKESAAAATPAAAPEAVPAPPASFKQSCLACHEDNVIKQQRLTKAQWDREINKMVGWGAKIKDSDRPALLDYLSKTYPYRMK